MAGGRLDELGTGKPKVPRSLWAIGLIVPTIAVLGWLYWAEISAALGPTVIPVLSPVIPKPDGASPRARAEYDVELGVLWRDCRSLGDRQLSAEWRRQSGLYRVWLTQGAGCGRRVDNDTPGALRLGTHARPSVTLAPGTAAEDREVQKTRCDTAPAGLATHVEGARRFAGQPELGPQAEAVLRRFLADAPRLKWARPAGSAGDAQICTLRDQPPGETSGLEVQMSLGQDRP